MAGTFVVCLAITLLCALLFFLSVTSENGGCVAIVSIFVGCWFAFMTIIAGMLYLAEVATSDSDTCLTNSEMC